MVGLRGCFVVGLLVAGLVVLLFMRRASMMRGCRSESLRGLGLIWRGWIVLSECGISMSGESHFDESPNSVYSLHEVGVMIAWQNSTDNGTVLA